MNHVALIRAIEIDPKTTRRSTSNDQTTLERRAPTARPLREVAHPVITSQSIEFNEQNVEFGHAYES